MTRNKAIAILTTLQDGSGGTYEAIRMAIEALERETHDGCDGCMYEHYEELTEPCYSCKHNYTDRYMPEPKHDRDWIIGCIKHDGFIKTDRGDKANQIILEALKADTVDVVRCKDCKHHGMSNCPVWEGYITDDYMWCYFGERREE